MHKVREFEDKKKKIAIVGLGYVGLPLAVAFGHKYSVIGFDISERKVQALKEGKDETGELSVSALQSSSIQFTTTPSDLSDADVIIVTVPTPIDANKKPDLMPLKKASETIGAVMKKGVTVVYESTVYPGVTEDICVPILEATSGLTAYYNFTVGYSPERLSPGDSQHTLEKIVKVVSGSDDATRDFLTELYGSVVPAGIHTAPSIKVAEAAKVIENTQRDLNVALMNELSIIFNKMNINTLDVIDAAASKWNFMKMTPGLVGGHCIGVDPYYLTYKAEEIGYNPQVILSGRRINDNMGKYIAEQTIKKILGVNKQLKNASVLIMGLTFKENVADIRNSKVVDIIDELNEYNITSFIHDPYANKDDVYHEYGLTLTPRFEDIPVVDAVILAVPHREYQQFDLDVLANKISGDIASDKVLIDIKGVYKHVPSISEKFTYWML